MTTDTEKLLAEIRERAEKATKGPWVQFTDKGHPISVMPAMRPGDICQFGPDSRNENVDFIAHSISDIPFLLAEIERLTEEMRNERQQSKYMSDLRGMVRL